MPLQWKARERFLTACNLAGRGLQLPIPPSLRFHIGLKHLSGSVWPGDGRSGLARPRRQTASNPRARQCCWKTVHRAVTVVANDQPLVAAERAQPMRHVVECHVEVEVDLL